MVILARSPREISVHLTLRLHRSHEKGMGPQEYCCASESSTPCKSCGRATCPSRKWPTLGFGSAAAFIRAFVASKVARRRRFVGCNFWIEKTARVGPAPPPFALDGNNPFLTPSFSAARRPINCRFRRLGFESRRNHSDNGILNSESFFQRQKPWFKRAAASIEGVIIGSRKNFPPLCSKSRLACHPARP